MPDRIRFWLAVVELSLLAAMGLFAASADAQAPTSPDSAASTTVVVTPGAAYAAGRLHRALFGADYRTLWTTPIAVDVLDLHAFAGGLTPVQRGGSMQTKSLRLRAHDGAEYVFRTLEKDQSSSLPPELRQTLVRRVYQDQVASYHPAAALVVARLLDATGIRHARPQLVVMPDDAVLGEFRAEFAGRLGTFEVRPERGFDDGPDAAGATEVVSSERLFAALQSRPTTRVDTRAYLAARLFDVFVGDRDRHRDQWRWARFGDADAAWKAIPRDRDMAFVRHEGALLAVARAWNPQLVGFGPAYGSMEGLNWNAREIDRRLLSGLSRAVWDSTTRALQAQLTDSVIDGALDAMPAPFRAQDAATLREALVRRRDRLGEAASAFYALLAREVDLRGGDRADLLVVTRLDGGGVDVSLSSLARADSAAPPYARRRFDPSETSEIRVYLHGGDDRAVVRGASAHGVVVRIVGGDGDDTLVDSTGAGGERTRFYDAVGNDHVTHAAAATQVDRRPYTPPPSSRPQDPPRDWGHEWRPALWTSSAPDVGLFLGGGRTLTRYAFRADPYASRVTLVGGYSLGTGRARAQLTADLRRPNARSHVELVARASGIELLRFHGLGNASSDDAASEYYRVHQSQLLLAPTFVTPIGSSLTMSAGAVGQLASTGTPDGTLIGTTRPYGSGTFGQLGGRVGVALDTRDRPVAATRGVAASVGGTLFPALWDVERAFGEAHGSVATYLTAHAPLEPTLALRAGGQRVWGRFPFHEAAFLGGASTLRGWGEQRFAGDAAVYGNAELRLFLTRFFLLVPGDLGVFGLADAGRVYASGEQSSTWHSSFGGGVWVAPLKRSNTISLGVASSAERTGLYVRSGFLF
jgi:hypothetical protein